MTLFTKEDCILCDQLKQQFDLEAMEVRVEVLGSNDADALAHLAWHGLVETARKALPILVLDDSSSVHEFPHIETHLQDRASRFGLSQGQTATGRAGCAGGACALQ